MRDGVLIHIHVQIVQSHGSQQQSLYCSKCIYVLLFFAFVFWVVVFSRQVETVSNGHSGWKKMSDQTVSFYNQDFFVAKSIA